MSQRQPTHGFTDTLTRIIVDEDFRRKVLEDSEAALTPLGLTPGDRELLAQTVRDRRTEIEEISRQLAQGTPTFQQILLVVEYKPPVVDS